METAKPPACEGAACVKPTEPVAPAAVAQPPVDPAPRADSSAEPECANDACVKLITLYRELLKNSAETRCVGPTCSKPVATGLEPSKVPNQASCEGPTCAGSLAGSAP